MQRTRVAFYLYLVENALNIVLALVLVHPLGVRGLALSLSIAYSVSALLALAIFHQWFGRLAERETWAPLVRVVIAAVPMAVVVLVVSNLSASTSVAGLAIGSSAPCSPAASPSARSSSGWDGATTRTAVPRRGPAAPTARTGRTARSGSGVGPVRRTPSTPSGPVRPVDPVARCDPVDRRRPRRPRRLCRPRDDPDAPMDNVRPLSPKPLGTTWPA